MRYISGMDRILAATFLALLSGCGAQPSAPAPAVAEAASEPLPAIADRNAVASYGSGVVIHCGMHVMKSQLGQVETGEPEDTVKFQKMHASLDGYPSAQNALKSLRSAETECFRTASTGIQDRVRKEWIKLQTELETIPFQ